VSSTSRFRSNFSGSSSRVVRRWKRRLIASVAAAFKGCLVSLFDRQGWLLTDSRKPLVVRLCRPTIGTTRSHTRSSKCLPANVARQLSLQLFDLFQQRDEPLTEIGQAVLDAWRHLGEYLSTKYPQ
jgi:hypothetical protein